MVSDGKTVMERPHNEWKAHEALECDEINAIVMPGCLVRVAISDLWGIPAGPTTALGEKFFVKGMRHGGPVDPNLLPIGIVIARAGDAKKGRHVACVLLAKEQHMLWFRISDLIVLQSP